jgi:hypothetical protein
MFSLTIPCHGSNNKSLTAQFAGVSLVVGIYTRIMSVHLLKKRAKLRHVISGTDGLCGNDREQAGHA